MVCDVRFPNPWFMYIHGGSPNFGQKLCIFAPEIPKIDVKALQMSQNFRMGVYTLMLSQTKIFLFTFKQF